ncbi:hypothetical protein BpHYR1_039792 [Brachionus plicatilis]|uniref:Uncharacterized protein n=1 Tax=Brachionus plicatilis TaxID=10195 RepID=A0A3M7PGJ5_BRAPC|nr:hypothetical protein BpHYR1_039792 [Brachionus plicatilis]
MSLFPLVTCHKIRIIKLTNSVTFKLEWCNIQNCIKYQGLLNLQSLEEFKFQIQTFKHTSILGTIK